MKSRTISALRFAVLFLFLASAAAAQQQDTTASSLAAYIDKSWDSLTRSMANCETITDKRVPEHSLMYLPADFQETDQIRELGERCHVAIEHLPQRIMAPGQIDPEKLPRQGVLYLPNPYVVPGGFFNEMYGWDSYFIIRGLLRAGRVKLAQGIVENFFFEIDHYGSILNANRTYFLTRSQPPFLSSMVMDIYDALPDASKRAWLEKSYLYIQRDYDLWVRGEHLAGGTGLSRYFDYGQGPVPEIADMHDPYYRNVFTHIQALPEREEFLKDASKTDIALTGPSFTFEACEQNEVGCTKSPSMKFTVDYYKGDRAMRESGFDISYRFGPFGGGTHHFAPVCLNSLLYKEETDLEKIATILGRSAAETKEWHERAQGRKKFITRYMWDASKGMFFDYDFTTKKRSAYEYVTTFYPLWAGLATPQQAKAVIANLKDFERKGGLLTSPYKTGVQWDAPYGWAPLQLMAVEGLRHYSATADADRAAREWVSTVEHNFAREGTIHEKYNVETQTSETRVTAGYQQNVVGFGWTNGVTLEFMYELGMLKGKAAAPGTD